MRKLKFFLDFDKEERWLNRLAAQGHLLSKAAFATYTFTEIEPGTAVVRVDYRPSMSEADYADYVTLFADSGWQHLSGSRKAGAHYKGGAQYFASFDADPDADIFSDAPLTGRPLPAIHHGVDHPRLPAPALLRRHSGRRSKPAPPTARLVPNPRTVGQTRHGLRWLVSLRDSLRRTPARGRGGYPRHLHRIMLGGCRLPMGPLPLPNQPSPIGR